MAAASINSIQQSLSSNLNIISVFRWSYSNSSRGRSLPERFAALSSLGPVSADAARRLLSSVVREPDPDLVSLALSRLAGSHQRGVLAARIAGWDLQVNRHMRTMWS